MTLDRCVLGFIHFRSSISLFASECYPFHDYLVKKSASDRTGNVSHRETGLRPGPQYTYVTVCRSELVSLVVQCCDGIILHIDNYMKTYFERDS